MLLPALRPCAAQEPLVVLDAERLRPGPLSVWHSGGRLEGPFAVEGETPAVELVDGRKAVVFSGKQFLRSAAPAPPEISGGRAFSVAAWVHPSRVTGRQVIASWGARRDDRIEFCCGRGRGNALTAGRTSAGFARTPPAGQWHHLAFTYRDGHLCIYIDGEPDSVHKLKLTPETGFPLVVAAVRDAGDARFAGGFRGALAALRIWDRELCHREIRNDMGLFGAFGPQPADGAVCDERRIALRWHDGLDRTARCRVFFGTDRSAVEAMNARALLAELPASPDHRGEVAAGTLTPGLTYAWRVEQLAADGSRLDAGKVWTFRVSEGPASAPLPRTNVAGVPADTRRLSWKPGRYARSQTVYFGTDREAVNAGSAVLAAGLPPSQTDIALPAPLEHGRTYYWRVAQDNGELPPAAGQLWTFRTEDMPVPGHLTFFVVSDTHYGLDWRVEPAVQQLIDDMNFLPGTALPPGAGGGIVRTPRGVIHLGDITNDGKADQWQAFVRDFGLKGEARLAYPVYELFGNHDGGAAGAVRKGIIERNRARASLTAVSSNGLHYAWEWEGIRFINVNISPGPTTRPYDPQHSSDFLRDQLARLRDRNQPVILLQHFGFDKRESLRWWPEEWRKALSRTIAGFNVVAIFHGHDHETDIYAWNGIDVFDAPHVRDADVPERPVRHGYFVVQIADGRMAVAERRLDRQWGMACLRTFNWTKGTEK